MSKAQARIAVALENVVMQLRRRNDMTEAFYREALDVLTRITEDPFEAPPAGPCTSSAPAVMSGSEWLPRQACKLRHGHEGLHESDEGSRWTNGAGSPVGSGQPAAAPDGQEGGKA